ncbi:MAG: aromatic amino acid lyase [Alphaproteobacteria bacterium]
MTVVLASRRDFTLSNFARVAFDGESVRFSTTALKTIGKAHADFQVYVDKNRGKFIYGVTSGAGPEAKNHRTPEQQKKRMRRGLPFAALAFGDDMLPDSVVRGAIFASLAMFIDGTTATSPDRVRLVAGMLDKPLPPIPAQGLTAAGEIMPLFALFGPSWQKAAKGFHAGNGNGAPFVSAMGAVAAIQARRRLELVEKVFALSIEALAAPLEPYDPALKPLWQDPYEGRALDGLNRWLRGVPRKGRRSYEAPVSWNILPRVLGQAHRAVATLEQTASYSIAVAASNPTFVPPHRGLLYGKTISTGTYHNAIVPPALDGVAASWVDLATLAHRHSVKLHKGEYSLLPDGLLPTGTDWLSGHSTTLLEYVANSFVDEMRDLMVPNLLSPVEPAASEQDDISSPGFAAWRAEAKIARLMDMVLAVLAAVVSQALWVTKRKAPSALIGFLEEIRTLFPVVESTRRLGDDGKRLADAFSAMIQTGAANLVQPTK